MEEEYLFASGMHVLFFNVAVHVRYFEVCFFFQDAFQRKMLLQFKYYHVLNDPNISEVDRI